MDLMKPYTKKKCTGTLSKLLRLLSYVQIKNFSTLAVTGWPFLCQYLSCCCSISALGVQWLSQRPLRFHDQYSVSNPSNFIHQEAGLLWWNFSLLGKDRILSKVGTVSYFFFISDSVRTATPYCLLSSPLRSNLWIHWAHPSFVPKKPPLCHRASGVEFHS